MTLEGQTITISIDIEKSELNLTSLGDEGFYKKISANNSQPFIATINSSSYDTAMKQKLCKVSQTITRLLTKKLGF